MRALTAEKQKLKVFITVKTYPIPSAKYDELVCTAGVTETGDFVRFYPINFRDLPFSQQYKKYQWIEIIAEKHQGRDARKESYLPESDSIQILGEPIKSNPGNWSERARFALAKKAHSMEELHDRRKRIGHHLAFSSRRKCMTSLSRLTNLTGNPLLKQHCGKRDFGSIARSVWNHPARYLSSFTTSLSAMIHGARAIG